jgi:hypothetical protein
MPQSQFWREKRCGTFCISAYECETSARCRLLALLRPPATFAVTLLLVDKRTSRVPNSTTLIMSRRRSFACERRKVTNHSPPATGLLQGFRAKLRVGMFTAG